jgi:hypothetical protein
VFGAGQLQDQVEPLAGSAAPTPRGPGQASQAA